MCGENKPGMNVTSNYTGKNHKIGVENKPYCTVGGMNKVRDMRFEDFVWTREPKQYVIDNTILGVITSPYTDLWQRTYYHFRNDNAPVFQIETEEKYFSFIVKTSFEDSHHRFDQCGIVMYLDSDNWLKGSIEYENEEFQHLGSVVTNYGYSDWATSEIPANIKSMWVPSESKGR